MLRATIAQASAAQAQPCCSSPLGRVLVPLQGSPDSNSLAGPRPVPARPLSQEAPAFYSAKPSSPSPSYHGGRGHGHRPPQLRPHTSPTHLMSADGRSQEKGEPLAPCPPDSPGVHCPGETSGPESGLSSFQPTGYLGSKIISARAFCGKRSICSPVPDSVAAKRSPFSGKRLRAGWRPRSAPSLGILVTSDAR